MPNPKPRVFQRIQELRKLIETYDRQYHEEDAPTVSDAVYDRLKIELKELEMSHPQWDDPNSPTHRIGSKVRSDFAKVEHSIKMLSLENAFSTSDLEDFEKRLCRFLQVTKPTWTYLSELKIDGLAIELIYQKGSLFKASTRGDGSVGEDITENVRAIKSIPPILNKKVSLEVRGEIFIEVNDFQKLNKQRQQDDLPLFANPRNAAAGSLRQLDPSITASRPLKLLCYALGLPLDCPSKTQKELLSYFKDLGLPVNSLHKHCKDLNDVEGFYQEMAKRRSQLSFQVDGIVVKVNEFKFRDELGSTSNHPRWGIAYKFDAPVAYTTLESIEVQVGRTGILTPVAVLAPVEIGGVTVTSASLHNEDEISRLKLRIGDRVEVIRSGDVIPKIIGVKEGKNGKLFRMPEVCPSCETKLLIEEGVVGRRCPNTHGCPAQSEGRIIHFASKDALNIEGLGPQWIAQFLEKGWVKQPSDLFSLSEEQLLTLDRMGEILARKMIQSIQSRKKTSLARALYGLGIPHVGETLAQKLAKGMKNLSDLFQWSEEGLLAIDDVGPKVARAVLAFRDQNEEEIRKLDSILTFERLKEVWGPWRGMNFVLTGTLSAMPRSQAQIEIEKKGGQIQSSITKTTHVLVVGAEPGSKLEKAKKMGLQIWDEKQFLGKLSGEDS